MDCQVVCVSTMDSMIQICSNDPRINVNIYCWDIANSTDFAVNCKKDFRPLFHLTILNQFKLVKCVHLIFSSKLHLEDTRSKLMTDDKDGDGSVTWNEHMVSTYGMEEEELKDYQENDVEDPELKEPVPEVVTYMYYKSEALTQIKFLADSNLFAGPLEFKLTKFHMCKCLV